MRIWIYSEKIDPYLKPYLDPDREHFFKIKFLRFFPHFFVCRNLKNHSKIRDLKKSIISFESKKDFLPGFGRFFAPWIRICGSKFSCGSGSRKRSGFQALLQTQVLTSMGKNVRGNLPSVCQ